jgi:two-component sensor histidine kinase
VHPEGDNPPFAARNSRIKFRVQGDGNGTGQEREGSLGYGLVKTLVKQLRGELHIQEEPGVTATIVFVRASIAVRRARL